MSITIMGAPSRYIQGKNIIEKCATYIRPYGQKGLFLSDAIVMPLVKNKIIRGTEKSIDLKFELFAGESTENEINRIVESAKNTKADFIIGCGGGKTIDTAKAVGFRGKIPTIIIPTAASTDAPCSSLSVIYSETGAFIEDLFLPQNPNLVLVDTQIIANAPTRLLVAGMGDAFATYYEARACRSSDADNMFGGKGSNSAFALATLCKEILLADGYHAKLAAENNKVTKALENIVEANIYLSGVGFENNGCAMAHGVYNGFTQLNKSYSFLHGECVAFGTLVQLVIENVPKKELNQVFDFFSTIGLPTTLSDLGLNTLSEDEFVFVAKAIEKIKISKNLPFEVTWQTILDAIYMVDVIGKERRK